MARRSAEAIVLATRNWGEADKMASLLTRECGRVEAAAFGCRRPKSALAAGMQMF
ncbi:MAG: DNA repair protein RecO, partial [Selenomonas sp.]